MKKPLIYFLVLALSVSLLSGLIYAAGFSADFDAPGQTPVSGADVDRRESPEPTSPEPTPSEPASPEPTPPESAPPEPASPEPTPPEPASPEPTPPEPASPEPTPLESAPPEPASPEPTPPKPVYPDLSLRERADDSFFADTAILGNSLVDGLRLYSRLNVDYYCGTSMSVVSAMYTQNVLLQNGTYGTQLDAIAQKQYGKVYIQLGINEIGNSVDYFIGNYRAMLNQIRATQPNADIYIMAVTPTSRDKNDTAYNRDRVILYNEALYDLAADWGCYYLDDFTPLADGEGYLPASDSWDGVHFAVAKYAVWEEVIRTHYA